MNKTQYSIRDVIGKELTRKEKADIIDRRIAEFEDAVKEIEEHLRSMQAVSKVHHVWLLIFFLIGTW